MCLKQVCTVPADADLRMRCRRCSPCRWVNSDDHDIYDYLQALRDGLNASQSDVYTGHSTVTMVLANISTTYLLDHEKSKHAYWWLEDFFTILTATVLVIFGAFSLVSDLQSGRSWYKPSFWCAPMPAAEDTTGNGGEEDGIVRKAVHNEKTPLKPE